MFFFLPPPLLLRVSYFPRFLPRDLGDDALGERAHDQLAHLVRHQNGKRTGNRVQPVLDWDGSCEHQALDTGHLGHEDGDQEGGEHAGKEPEVAALGADGVGLQDRHAAVADGEDVAPLDNDLEKKKRDGMLVHCI